VENCIKFGPADVSRYSWISVIEVHYKVRYGNFGGRLLEVIFVAISYKGDQSRL